MAQAYFASSAVGSVSPRPDRRRACNPP